MQDDGSFFLSFFFFSLVVDLGFSVAGFAEGLWLWGFWDFGSFVDLENGVEDREGIGSMLI